jgi:hypothetical protein
MEEHGKHVPRGKSVDAGNLQATPEEKKEEKSGAFWGILTVLACRLRK